MSNRSNTGTKLSNRGRTRAPIPNVWHPPKRPGIKTQWSSSTRFVPPPPTGVATPLGRQVNVKVAKVSGIPPLASRPNVVAASSRRG
jgi:hypothetical protein